MDMRKMFFDTQHVRSRVDAGTRKVLSKFGAFVRRTARRSIRKRKRPSAPGAPPSSHTGLLKRFIFFGYDANAKSVVIGPQRLSQNGRGAAPSLLEYGGTTAIETRKGRQRTRIEARPFMGPAFEQEQAQLPELWRDAMG
ncbi:MAG: hypothetical protein JXQ75_03175 [Phycisphaerae bacterium]|nr:hypothetical protein [Phycisphaerae bacterium]